MNAIIACGLTLELVKAVLFCKSCRAREQPERHLLIGILLPGLADPVLSSEDFIPALAKAVRNFDMAERACVEWRRPAACERSVSGATVTSMR